MYYLDCNEKQQHGTAGFPVAYYGLNEKHPRYFMPAHWHREIEFVRVRQGAFVLYLEEHALRLEQGDLAMIGEAVIHSGKPEQDCEYECIVMDLQQLLSATQPGRTTAKMLMENSIRVHADAQNTAMSAAIDMLFLSASCENRELAVMSSLYAVLDAMQTATNVQHMGYISGHRRTEQLKPVIEYLEANYAKHITLEELAKMAGLSPKYFCRYFQTIVHRSPFDYLNFFRVEKACNALSSSEMSVAEIAYSCGFSDSSYFIKQFRKYKGITPKQYQKQSI